MRDNSVILISLSFHKDISLIIFRYLAKQVLTTMLAVTFVLLLVFMSGRFIKYLSKAASGGISPDVLFSIMAYRLPGFLELILPLGFFIGILLAYGRMYLESEMTVLHACGMSQNRLLSLTLVMSLGVAGLVGWMSLYQSPQGMQRVGEILSDQAKMTEFEMLFPGKFQRIKSGDRVTYTESLSEDKRVMFNVFISEGAKEGEPIQFIFARSGTQQLDSETGERFLLLHEGTRYQGIPGSRNFRSISFDSYGIKIEESDIEKRTVKEEAIPTRELLSSNDDELQALLHWRISLPLLVPVITLIAVSVCRVNPRQGRFFHLFPAMLLYVIYLGLLIVVRKKMAKGDLPDGVGLWLVHLIFLFIGMAMWNKDKLKSLFAPKSKSLATEAAKG